MQRMTMRHFLDAHPYAEFKHRTRRTFTTREMTNFYSASLDAQVIYDEATGEVSPGGQTVAEYILPQWDYMQGTGMLPDPFADLMPHRALPPPAEDE